MPVSTAYDASRPRLLLRRFGFLEGAGFRGFLLGIWSVLVSEFYRFAPAILTARNFSDS